MRLSLDQFMTLDCRLRLLHVKPKNTALILGYLKSSQAADPLQATHYTLRFESAAQDLRKRGIKTFLFLYWDTFDKVFLQALLNTRRPGDQYVLVSEGLDENDIPPDHPFDEILQEEDLYSPEDENLYEIVLAQCSVVATFGIKDLIPYCHIAEKADKQKKVVLSME